MQKENRRAGGFFAHPTGGQKVSHASALTRAGALAAVAVLDKRKAGKYPPGTHSPQWAPEFKPTVRSFIVAETAVLLDLLKPGQQK